jgi:hypothetical protein
VSNDKRRGDWIQTYSGKAFWPLDPKPEDIDMVDIAHALSNKCRYQGHTTKFYCPTEDQRILLADLRWVPAGDIKNGDMVLGFDEVPCQVGAAGNKRRRIRPSIVTHCGRIKRKTLRLEFSDGSTVRNSYEHPWLVATKQARNQAWISSESLLAAVNKGRSKYMHKFLPVWNSDNSRKGGWLAGMFDGEGYVSIANRHGIQLGVAQNTGLIFDRLQDMLREFNFDFSSSKVGNRTTMCCQIRGGFPEILRLLGHIRPERLINKFMDSLEFSEFDKQLDGKKKPLKIINIYEEGEEWVVGIETSTHTYLCEGFGAHNSVSEHSCHIATCFGSQLHLPPSIRLRRARLALGHEFGEAYLPDVPRPIKQGMPFFCEAEDRIQAMALAKFGIEADEEDWVAMHDADWRICLDERAALLGPSPQPWGALEDLEPLGVTIQALPPDEAEQLFWWNLRTYGVIP